MSYDRFFATTTLCLLESNVTTARDSRRLSTSRDSSSYRYALIVKYVVEVT